MEQTTDLKNKESNKNYIVLCIVISLLSFVAIVAIDIFKIENIRMQIIFATSSIIFTIFICTEIIIEKLKELEKN